MWCGMFECVNIGRSIMITYSPSFMCFNLLEVNYTEFTEIKNIFTQLWNAKADNVLVYVCDQTRGPILMIIL